MPDRPQRTQQALLDTSVIINLGSISADALPEQVAISAITMAELAAGPAAAGDPAERARRQDRLQRAEAAFDPLPFDIEAARAYGRLYAAVTMRKTYSHARADGLAAAGRALDELWTTPVEAAV